MRIDEGIIKTAGDYFAEIHEVGDDELNDMIDWEETGEDFPITMQEFELVTEIIALQMSYFCLRRVTHSCQSNTDSVYSMLNKKYSEYSELFGKEFNDLNEDKLH